MICTQTNVKGTRYGFSFSLNWLELDAQCSDNGPVKFSERRSIILILKTCKVSLKFQCCTILSSGTSSDSFSSFAPHRFSNLKIKQLWLTGGGGRDGGGGGGGSLMTWINRRSKRASAQPVRRRIGTRTNTRAQTSSRRAQTRLTEVIRDRWLSQTETSLSSSHGGDAVAASLFCSSDCCPIASLTADYKDSACKPTSGAPRAK